MLRIIPATESVAQKPIGVVAGVEEQLAKRVVGQPEPLAELLACYRRYAAGLAPMGRPAGIYLLLGPTGSGKTLLAQRFAEVITQKPNGLLKIDGGEFTQSHEIAKLIGAPPGYLGHRETPGQLCASRLTVQRSDGQSLAIVLVDEVDKMHPRCLDLLLGIFDTGKLTMGDNQVVDFTDTIILMTGNTGAKQVQEMLAPTWGLGANTANPVTDLGKVVESAARRILRPELFNRIDKVLTFQPLSQESLKAILELEIVELAVRLAQRRNISLELTQEAKDLLLRIGYDPRYGARELKRTIVKLLEQPLATKIVNGDFSDHSMIDVGVAGNELVFEKVM